MQPSISELNFDGGCVIEYRVTSAEVDQPIGFKHTLRRTPRGIFPVLCLVASGAPSGQPYCCEEDIDKFSGSDIIVRFPVVGLFRFIPF